MAMSSKSRPVKWWRDYEAECAAWNAEQRELHEKRKAARERDLEAQLAQIDTNATALAVLLVFVVLVIMIAHFLR